MQGLDGPKRIRGPSIKPPKREGEIWKTVKVLQEHMTSPKLSCLNCGKQFCGGLTRIKQHICKDAVLI